MTQTELIARLTELHPQLQLKDTQLAVKVILDAMSNTLSKGDRVEIRGFGSFGLNYKPPRQGRNPKMSPFGVMAPPTFGVMAPLKTVISGTQTEVENA